MLSCICITQLLQATDEKPNYMMGVENPIKDRTFLGKKVAKLCVGVDVYWSMPSCGDPDMIETEEVKSADAGEVGDTSKSNAVIIP